MNLFTFILFLLLVVSISVFGSMFVIKSENKKEKILLEKRKAKKDEEQLELLNRLETIKANNNNNNNNNNNKYSYMPYPEYLQTEHWRNRRIIALRKAGYKCQVCCSKNKLDVHHNNYKNLWNELDTDLVVLCHPCHDLFHKNSKLK